MRGFNINTPIEDIGNALTQYIIDRPEKFYRTIDIGVHSMGGLVVRFMIKNHYADLVEAGYRIDDVALIATPNHGTYSAAPPLFTMTIATTIGVILMLISPLTVIAGLVLLLISLLTFLIWYFLITFFGEYQSQQMAIFTGTNFIRSLNTPDETPYGIDDVNSPYRHITWSTFRGHRWHPLKILFFFVYPFDLGEHDGLVGGWSVPLEGAQNYGPYSLNHEELLWINAPRATAFLADLFYELTTTRSI